MTDFTGTRYVVVNGALTGTLKYVTWLEQRVERLLDLSVALGHATSEPSEENTERADELWRALPDDLRRQIEHREALAALPEHLK